jgi:fructose-1,6-bisphosphatase
MVTRELLLKLISEEKENFSKYSQACANYQISVDPLALAKSQGRLEILNKILKEI